MHMNSILDFLFRRRREVAGFLAFLNFVFAVADFANGQYLGCAVSAFAVGVMIMLLVSQ